MRSTGNRPKDQPEPVRQRTLWALGIFALALLVRGIHLAQIREAPFFAFYLGDAGGYHAWAREIAGGKWLGSQVFYQAPLYPYFLGVIYSTLGESLLVTRACQAVLGAASCGLMTLAGWRWFGKATGIAAGLIMAVYAPAIFYDSLIQKSVLDLFFLSLMLWLLGWIVDEPRPGLWAWLGVALGGLILTRENALVFVAAIFIWLPIHFRELGRRRLAFAGLFLVGLAAVLLPVAVRNAVVGGEFHLTTSQFGPNFYIGNNPKADGTYLPLRPGRGVVQFERTDAIELAEAAEDRKLTDAEVSRYWTRRALAYITSQPGDWLLLKARTLALAYNVEELVDTEDPYTYADHSVLLRLTHFVLHFGVLAPLTVLGIWITWTQRDRLWLLYLMLVLYTAAIVAFFMFGRYRYPLVPLLVLFAAAGVTQLPAFWRSRSAGRIAACFAAVAAMALFCNWPMISVDQMRGVTHYNVGTALAEAGNVDEAVHEFRRAAKLNENDAEAHNALGDALRKQGRPKEAIAHLQRALNLHPQYAEAHFSLGNLLAQHGQADVAAAHFRKAIECKPDFAEAHYNLGLLLHKHGKPREAEESYRQALDVDPNHAGALTSLGNLRFAGGKFSEAADFYRRAIAVRPNVAQLHRNLGAALASQGNWPEAAKQFERAIEIRPDDAKAYCSLGQVFVQQGKLREAASRFRRALEINPQYADARASLDRVELQIRETN